MGWPQSGLGGHLLGEVCGLAMNWALGYPRELVLHWEGDADTKLHCRHSLTGLTNNQSCQRLSAEQAWPSEVERAGRLSWG